GRREADVAVTGQEDDREGEEAIARELHPFELGADLQRGSLCDKPQEVHLRRPVVVPVPSTVVLHPRNRNPLPTLCPKPGSRNKAEQQHRKDQEYSHPSREAISCSVVTPVLHTG